MRILGAGTNGVAFSGKGLAVAPLGGWGNLRYAANAAFMMAVIAKQTSDAGVKASALDFAKNQVAYFTGSSGRSFIVGYGTNPPAQPHHRAASCPNRPAPCGQAQFAASGGCRGQVSVWSRSREVIYVASRECLSVHQHRAEQLI